NGYHGGTQATMGLTAHGNWKFKTSAVVNVKHAVPGYCYRCPLGLEYPNCEGKCARDTGEMIRYGPPGGGAGFIGGRIPGCGRAGDSAEGVLPDRLRDRPQARRAVHCGRGPDSVRPDRRTLLGLRKLGRHPGYGDDGEGTG